MKIVLQVEKDTLFKDVSDYLRSKLNCIDIRFFELKDRSLGKEYAHGDNVLSIGKTFTPVYFHPVFAQTQLINLQRFTDQEKRLAEEKRREMASILEIDMPVAESLFPISEFKLEEQSSQFTEETLVKETGGVVVEIDGKSEPEILILVKWFAAEELRYVCDILVENPDKPQGKDFPN